MVIFKFSNVYHKLNLVVIFLNAAAEITTAIITAAATTIQATTTAQKTTASTITTATKETATIKFVQTISTSSTLQVLKNLSESNVSAVYFNNISVNSQITTSSTLTVPTATLSESITSTVNFNDISTNTQIKTLSADISNLSTSDSTSATAVGKPQNTQLVSTKTPQAVSSSEQAEISTQKTESSSRVTGNTVFITIDSIRLGLIECKFQYL